MKVFVVDASVAIKWFIPEVHAEAADEWLRSADLIAAPDLIAAEIGNIVWKLLRRGQLTVREATDIVAQFGKLGLESTPSMELLPSAVALAAELDQTVYDSLYLALAIRRNWTLITADQKFYSAAKESLFAAYVGWVADSP